MTSQQQHQLLPQLISELFQQTFVSKKLTNLFDQIEPLFHSHQQQQQQKSIKNQQLHQLLWARILFHLVSLFKQDASQKLLERSLEASRVCLISNNDNDRHNDTLQLNFMIREVQLQLFTKVRVLLVPSLENNNKKLQNNSHFSSSRIMIASNNSKIKANDLICKEKPFAVWSGQDVGEGLKAINTSKNNNEEDDDKNNNLVMKRAKVDSLWCPDMYLSEAISTFLSGNGRCFTSRRDARDVASLRANCHSYFERDDDDDDDHTRIDENKSSPTTSSSSNNKKDQIAVFDVLSKISHSCSPNCFYDGTGRLVSSKDIVDNDNDRNSSSSSSTLLSFPYFHRKFLLRGTSARREALDQSHNFVCGCARCANFSNPSAHGRSFICKNCNASSGTVSEVVSLRSCNTKSTNTNSNFFVQSVEDSTKWVCSKCNDSNSNNFSEMQRYFSIEARLEQSTSANLSQLSSSSGVIPKNIFERLKSDLLDCVNNLGKNHWLYLECVRVMIQFYLRVALPSSSSSSSSAVSQTTKTICLEFALRWSLKFVSSLKHQEIITKYSPSAATSYAVEAAKALLEHCPNSEWRIHAALMLQMARDVDQSFLNRNSYTQQLEKSSSSSSSFLDSVLDLAGKALQIYNENNEHSWTPQSGQRPKSALEAVVRTADIVDADEPGLLAAWETHLSDRVAALLQRQGGGGNNSTNASAAAAAAQIRSRLNLPPA